MEIQGFIAGWSGGTIGILLGNFQDTIKTSQQTSKVPLTVREVAVEIFKTQGIQGFYKGTTIPLLTTGALNSLYFGMYSSSFSWLQLRYRSYDEILPSNVGWNTDQFVGGFIGGSFQALVSCPSELIKIQMQFGRGVYKIKRIDHLIIYRQSSRKTFWRIYTLFGIPGFFVGFVPTFWRDSIVGGVFMLNYQWLRYNFYGQSNSNPGFIETIIAGGVARMPMDIVKSKIQADDLRSQVYKGTIDCCIEIYKKNGFYGFFKGLMMSLSRSVPMNIAIIYGYEITLTTMNYIINHIPKMSR